MVQYIPVALCKAHNHSWQYINSCCIIITNATGFIFFWFNWGFDKIKMYYRLIFLCIFNDYVYVLYNGFVFQRHNESSIEIQPSMPESSYKFYIKNQNTFNIFAHYVSRGLLTNIPGCNTILNTVAVSYSIITCCARGLHEWFKPCFSKCVKICVEMAMTGAFSQLLYRNILHLYNPIKLNSWSVKSCTIKSPCLSIASYQVRGSFITRKSKYAKNA